MLQIATINPNRTEATGFGSTVLCAHAAGLVAMRNSGTALAVGCSP